MSTNLPGDPTTPPGPVPPGPPGPIARDLARTPDAPFPGLRPFLEHEEILIYGRETQIEDLVECLRSSCFVAVIGGSGSGKSSLVRAGVVPHLRQYGIPEVGDVWLPVVFTPGTNAAATPDVRAGTPLTRLAWKLEHLLLQGPASAERREAIAALLRRPAGLARFVDSYSTEFKLEGDLHERARLLIVVDQFEELFDPSNRGERDAQLLIERVIEHFHSAARDTERTRNQRCFVAITMRSEHLNDCPAYPGLPEAINKSSYLVSRIEGEELRKAIRSPIDRFLRLRHRQLSRTSAAVPSSPPARVALPDRVEIDERVIERLAGDTERLAHNPDHLPLLQHALARLWDAAMAREQIGELGVPTHITFDDLVVAATARQLGKDGAPLSVQDGDNVLVLSLQRWAEAVFLARHPNDTPQQADFIALLGQLVFKDLRAGTYNQQRVNVSDDRRKALWALVHPGFVGHGGYLFWDDEDPERITLKVQHESLIRGWERLRLLADQSAKRFERWVQLVKDSQEWVAGGHLAPDLMASRVLVRLQDEGVLAASDKPEQRRQWVHLLSNMGLHDNLQDGLAQVDAYVKASSQAIERARLRALKSRRNQTLRNRLYWGTPVVGCLVAYVGLIKWPELRRVEQYFIADSLARESTLAPSYGKAGAAQPKLEQLIKAVDSSQKARTGAKVMFGTLPDLPVLNAFTSTVLMTRLHDADALVNTPLRHALTQSVWTVARRPDTTRPDGYLPGSKSSRCQDIDGVYIVAGGPVSTNPVPKATPRAFFLSDAIEEQNSGSDKSKSQFLYTVAIDAKGRCELGNHVYNLPTELKPALMASADLGHLLLATTDARNPAVQSISVLPVDWTDGPWGRVANILPALTVLTDEHDAAAAMARAGSLSSTPTWPVDGGIAFAVGTANWRINGRVATRVETLGETEPVRLTVPAPDSACHRAKASLDSRDSPPPDFSQPVTSTYLIGRQCIAISVASPAAAAPDGPAAAGNGIHPQTALAYVRVLDLPHDSADGQTVRVQMTIPFGPIHGPEATWFVGTAGRHDGWLLTPGPAGQSASWSGLPLTTAALRHLARTVMDEGQPHPGPMAAASRPTSAPAQP